MAVYLVTGGAGFIGSHIVEQLVRRGERVRVLDNFSTGRRENLTPFLDQIELLEGDLRHAEICRRAVKGVEVVLHQAAVPSVQRSVDDPRLSHDANTTGTLNLLIAARDAGVRRLVYASSSSIYGDSPTLPKHEGMPPQPRSPYAASKIAGEYYCQVFTEVYGLETVSLRYFNVFGPRQDPTSQYAAVVPIFITALLRGEPVTVHGDGLQSRDFTYVSNNVQANLLAATAPEVTGRVFNIACGKRVTLLELLDVLAEIVAVDVKRQHTDPRPGDVKHSLADISRAQAELGYEVTVDLVEGLRRTVEWYRQRLAGSR